ncbi:MAG TPA: 50S ribosomal protein L4 [Chloroflexota bacterium]
MDVAVQSARGSAGTVQLDDRVFGVEPNLAVLHQATVAQLANRRQGTADTRTRGEVRGSTRKMWRQKGTGRARQGARTAPQWRGGGIVFGPHPRPYHQRLPKKMRQLALRSALSDRVASGALKVVDAIEIPDGRTKSLIELLAGWNVTGRTLIILGAADPLVRRAAGNIPNVFVALPHTFSVVELLQSDTVIVTREAVDRLGELLTPGAVVAAPEVSEAPIAVLVSVDPAVAPPSGDTPPAEPAAEETTPAPRRRAPRRAAAPAPIEEAPTEEPPAADAASEGESEVKETP